jgi:hypothetical protein
MHAADQLVVGPLLDGELAALGLLDRGADGRAEVLIAQVGEGE